MELEYLMLSKVNQKNKDKHQMFSLISHIQNNLSRKCQVAMMDKKKWMYIKETKYQGKSEMED